MLVLSRKNGESIRIGQSIEVTVLEVGGGRVKLGFSAPTEVAIQRNEIREAYPQPLGLWRRRAAVAAVCTP
jgi:carbon storage regulator